MTVAIGTNPGSGTLSGATSASTDSTGVAAFSGLSVDKAGTGYTLTAASAALTSAASSAFTISAATADRFVITSTAVSGTASAAATLGPITVEARDALVNPGAGADRRDRREPRVETRRAPGSSRRPPAGPA